ncbi:DUF6571 family protein [Streptomyces lichenis]|uniref:AG2 protein n=1 Tax=Streptomyces lichenis TaxID=2306967 RepID=A0ABT0IGG6_9ACTN|nr:DUF6571 family protein [Streptomyces lichenis]MCK8680409.1 hypothetical protein [Streptomyces lichenis]
MNLDDLRFADFSALDDAVIDWSKTITNLQGLEKTAREGLRGKANKASWKGENATVSKAFVGKTAGEFADAVTQATSIRDILKDTRDELRDWQKKVDAAVERGLAKNLTVTSTGGGFTVTMNIHPDRAAEGTDVPDHTPGDVTALRDEIQGLLDRATESDSSAATALRALVDLAEYGFSGAKYADRDGAVNALREAERLSALAKKDAKDLTAADFDALNGGLRKYAGDELFAERFAEQLGAKGTLRFWADLNTPQLNWKLGHERVDQYDELQRHLGLTLATATQADTAEMAAWKREMVDLGTQSASRNNSATGFQVMSSLMRWGDYDDRFLTSYGGGLIEAEKKYTQNGRHVALAWQHMGMDPLLNRTGSDSGSDPMTGFLKALSNSPGAATEFFNGTFVGKDEDHDFTEEAGGKEVKRELSTFDYLFEERDWPQERDDKGEESIEGRNNLALALEAATTGHRAGEMPTPDTPPHTPAQAGLMADIVASVSDDPERLTKYGHMSDSMGQIASEYLPDINRAISMDVKGNTDKLFPVAGSMADLSQAETTRFLVTIGQSEDAYAAVSVGQAAYMSNLMDYHFSPETQGDESLRYPQAMDRTVEDIAHRNGEVSGILAIGQQEAVVGPAAKEAKDFQDAVAQQKNAWSGAIGTGIGVGVSFIATPVGGAVASGVAGTVSSVVLEHIFQQSETDVLKDASQDAGRLWETNRRETQTSTQIAAQEAARAHGFKEPDSVLDWVTSGTTGGYSSASSNARHMADELETEIQPG